MQVSGSAHIHSDGIAKISPNYSKKACRKIPSQVIQLKRHFHQILGKCIQITAILANINHFNDPN